MLVVSIGSACGGQTAADIPPSSSDFPIPSPASVPYDDRLGALADVPGGRARIGGWAFDTYNLVEWSQSDGGVPTSLDIAPLTCTETTGSTGWNFGAEVIVAPFRLMTTEVTNRSYAVCVDAGVCATPDIPRTQDGIDWRSPQVANQPVLLTWTLADTFCRHYGGALPTPGEFARATVGDGETYAQPNMLALVLQCALAADGPNPIGNECTKLSAQGALADVGTDPNDVGPFGHFDLYGNAWEWTRGFFDYASAPFCSSTLYEHDILFAAPDAHDAADPTANAILYSPEDGLLGVPDATSIESYGASPEIAIDDPAQDYQGKNLLGFRCAFPTP